LLVNHYSAYSDVQRAINSIIHIILDESLNNHVYLNLINALYMLIDKCVFGTKAGVSHYLVENSNFFVVFDTILVVLMINL
jgi:hypothetical protein